jgi:hypothetical protein
VPITAGLHTLTWSYEKDYSTLGGSDAAWIDDVTLPPLAPVALSVSKSGNGTGTVTSNPAGINCGATCAISVTPGTGVTLTAVASAGSTFTGWSGGGCSGTGNCIVTVNAAASVSAAFTLQQFAVTVTKNGTGIGTVTSSPAGINCGATCSANYDFGTVVTLTASPGVSSVFSGWSGAGCTGTGTCSVNVSAAATVNAVFAILANPPGPPTGVTATPGNGLAVLSFTPPASNGGSPITGYTATCGAAPSVTGAASPLTVTGLANGVLVSCTVSANNINGSTVSTPVNVTPSAGALIALSKVLSRKPHNGATSSGDIQIDTVVAPTGAVTVEPRTIGSGHTLVFQFNVPINNAGNATATDPVTAGTLGTATTQASGNDVMVTLVGVPDGRRVQVTLTGVNTTFSQSIGVGFLLGDVNGSRSVTASDISAIKALSGNTAVTDTNYLLDISGNGVISSQDVTAAKAQAGKTLR